MTQRQDRFSLRKYRGIGLASVAVASLFVALGTSPVAAQENTSAQSSDLVETSALLAAVENQQGAVETTDTASVTESLATQSLEVAEPPITPLEEPVVAQSTEAPAAVSTEPVADPPAQPVEPGASEREVAPAAAEPVASSAMPQEPASEDAQPTEEASRLTAQAQPEAEGGRTALGSSGFRRAAAVETRSGEGDQQVAERLTDVLTEFKEDYGPAVRYETLRAEDQDRYKAAIYNEYANHLVENIFPNIQPAQQYSDIPPREATPLFTQYAREERQKRGNPVGADPLNLEALAVARQRALETYNQNLVNEPTVDAYTKQKAELAQQLIETVVQGQSLAALEADRRRVFGGLYLLHSQYNFDDNLPARLVTQDSSVTSGTVTPTNNALRNLIAVGSYATQASLRNKTDLGNLLNRNQDLYTSQIQPLLGHSQLALVEKLATNQGLSAGDYLLQQTPATVQLSSQVKPADTAAWLAKNTKLLVPILAQGQGLLVGLTRDSAVVGLTDVYRQASEQPALSLHQPGGKQVANSDLVAALDNLENYNTFLREASSYGSDKAPTTARPTVVRDSLVLPNAQGQRIWQTKASHGVVRDFFAPLGMDSASYNASANIDGEQQSENSFVAYNVKVLGKDKKGATLYSHEMTHANDERLLFDGSYQGTTRDPAAAGNRRQGQGPEVYARGLFEALDNTQTSAAGNIRPVFNFNTTVPVTNGRGDDRVHQIQPDEPLNTPEKLANYQHKLIKLLMWMEAKEAEVALTLPEADRKLYFNQVTQVPRTKPETDLTSTNDLFVRSQTAPSSLEDLVKGSYVTAGFVANGVNRFGLVETNGYNFIPLLDSFYGANYAPEGKNTVGDISFKRNAHEILGLHGFDAMLDYLSGRYKSDQEFYQALAARQADKASALEGKVEADPQTTKIRQYEELAKLDLKDVPDSIKAIYTPESLTRAIAADLALLKDPNSNDISLYSRLNNVRNLKQKLLSDLIETTDMMTSDPSKQILGEKTYDIIYVSNSGTGDGERPDTPMSDLQAALAKVKDGGKIVLMDTITERRPVTIDKALTIEGSSPDKVLLLNEDMTVNKPVTLKALNLQLNKSSQATGLIKTKADLTLDNVSTLISPQQESQRPAVLLEEAGQASPIQLNVLNNRDTKLAAVTAQTASQLSFDQGVSVTGPVTASGNTAVAVTSRSNFIDQFSGDQMSLTVDNANLGNAVIRVKDLFLTNRATVSLSEEVESQVTDRLSIPSGTRLGARTNSLAVKTLEGTGVLAFDESATFRADRGLSATDIRVTNNTLAYTDNKTYVIIPDRQVEPTVTLWQRDYALSPDAQGRYIYRAPYELYHDFLTEEDELRFLPDEVLDLLVPYVNNDGSDPALRLTQAPEKPAQPARTRVVDGNGSWEFVDWVPEILGDTGKIYDYKGIWRYVPTQAQPLTVVPAFSFEGASAQLFDRAAAPLPANRQVMSADEVVLPEAYTNLVTSTDQTGEWQFQGWSLVSSQPTNGQLDLVGRWLYRAYRSLPVTTIYEANDQAAVGSSNQVTDPGQSGQASAFTNQTVRPSRPRRELVGTRPSRQTKEVPSPTLYEADDTLAISSAPVLKQSGQPEVTITTTTYRLENGRAVANEPTVVVTSGRPTIYRVGTQPTVERVETASQLVYEADETLAVGSENVLKQSGQPGVSVKTTTYRLENGQAVANEPTVVVTSGRPTIYRVGTQPTIERVETASQILYEVDETLAVGSENVLKQSGQPGVTLKTTTYRLENGRAVANEPIVVIESGRPTIYRVGTQPTVERVETASQVVYESDDTLAVGSEPVLVQSGQSGITLTTTTYRLENGQAVANEPTVVIESGRPTIYRVGTQPTVERVETASQVVYEADETLAVGSEPVLVQSGQLGITLKTTTYRLENGQAVANEPTVVIESGRPTIYRVGTQPTVERVETASQVVYESDDTLAVGSEPVLAQSGQPEMTVTTTTYRLENGRAVANEPTVVIESGRPTIYRVGTQPTVERVETASQLVYEADETLAVGSEPVLKQSGQPEVTVTTTTYRLENGRVVANEPTVVVTSGRPTIYRVGTQPTVERLETTSQVVYESDDTLAVGSEPVLVQSGQPGVSVKTVTYRLENGRAVANEPTVVIESGRPTIYRVGTQPTVERVETASQLVYEADETLAVDSEPVLTQSGQSGVSVKTTSYRLENGRAVANEPTVVVTSGRPIIYRVGTQPTVERLETASQVVYESDDTLAVGSENVLAQSGQPGISVKTTTYRLENGLAVANEPTVVVTSGRPTIYRVGTKPTVDRLETASQVVYESDDTLVVGSGPVLVKFGQSGVTLKTTTYRLENGRAVANEPTVVVTSGRPTIYRVGTQPTVERLETASQVVYESDDTLAVGSEPVLAQSGQPGVTLKTTTYRLENGRAVANEPTVVIESGRPTIYRVGTKPTVERVETASQVVYESDETLAVGSENALKQSGQPEVTITTTTYRLENGQAVANDPTVVIDSGRPTIYRVGTQPTVARFETVLPVVEILVQDLPEGEVVEEVGRPRIEEQTTTYVLDSQTGQVQAILGDLVLIDQGQATVLRRGAASGRVPLEPIEEVPVETPSVQPVEEAPVETPSVQPIEEVPVETPSVQPVEEAPVETPSVSPVEEVPVEAPSVQPVEEVPVEAPSVQPIDEVSMAEAPSRPTETPGGLTLAASVGQSAPVSKPQISSIGLDKELSPVTVASVHPQEVTSVTQLPKTGEKGHQALTHLGLLSLLVASLGYLRRPKKD